MHVWAVVRFPNPATHRHSTPHLNQELCDSRFQSMRAEEAKQKAARAQKTAAQERGKEEEEEGLAAWAQGLSDFGMALQDFNRNHGPMQTALVALLSSSAAAQQFLERGRRACEFRKSVELAEAKRAPVVLGDQDLTVTLQRFKKGWRAAAAAPSSSDASSSSSSSSASAAASAAWWPTLRAELRSISEAVMGERELPASQKVRVVPLLFTQGRYLRELLKVLVPVGAIVGLSLHVMEGMSEAAVSVLGQLQLGLSTLALLPTDNDGGGLGAAAAAAGMAEDAAAAVGATVLLPWYSYSSSSSWMTTTGALDALTDVGWLGVNVLMLGWFMALNQVRVRVVGGSVEITMHRSTDRLLLALESIPSEEAACLRRTHPPHSPPITNHACHTMPPDHRSFWCSGTLSWRTRSPRRASSTRASAWRPWWGCCTGTASPATCAPRGSHSSTATTSSSSVAGPTDRPKRERGKD